LPEIFSLFPPTSILTADSPEVKPGRGKPNPDIFLAAAHSLGRLPRTILTYLNQAEMSALQPSAVRLRQPKEPEE
jgi:hypothetical protein